MGLEVLRRMFTVSLLAGLSLLIFAFVGLKDKDTDNVQNKIVKFGFILLGAFLIYVGIIDSISLFTDPKEYIEQRR
jgi:predicted transporter